MKSVLRVAIFGAVLAVGFAGTALAGDAAAKDYVPSGCKIEKTTICTIEIWLERKHKKNNREIRKMLMVYGKRPARKKAAGKKPKAVKGRLSQRAFRV